MEHTCRTTREYDNNVNGQPKTRECIVLETQMNQHSSESSKTPAKELSQTHSENNGLHLSHHSLNDKDELLLNVQAVGVSNPGATNLY